MKIGTIASLYLAASSVGAASSSLDNLMSLLDQLQEEVKKLSTEHGAKDDQIASLISQLAKCEESASGAAGAVGGGTLVPTGSAAAPEPTPSAPAPSPEPSTATTAVPPASGKGDSTFAIGQSWNYNLATPVDTSVDADIFFIDMDNGQDLIDELHGKGKTVVCYISIGTIENWRSDKNDFPSEAIGKDVAGWSGEKWLDVNNAQVRRTMSARVQMAKSMDCDAVEPDNMDVYSHGARAGVDVSEQDQIDYNSWFAGEVHAAGMAVGLKNAVELVPILVNDYDFALNESCHEWDECGVYADTFLAENKPVFNVEYGLGKSVCAEANALGLDTILKNKNLKAPLCSCVDPSRDMDCMF